MARFVLLDDGLVAVLLTRAAACECMLHRSNAYVAGLWLRGCVCVAYSVRSRRYAQSMRCSIGPFVRRVLLGANCMEGEGRGAFEARVGLRKLWQLTTDWHILLPLSKRELVLLGVGFKSIPSGWPRYRRRAA